MSETTRKTPAPQASGEKAASARSPAAESLAGEFPGMACVVLGADGTIVSWNADMEKILGWSAAEMTGRPAADFLPEVLLESHGPARAEVSARTKDGRTAALRAWSQPLTKEPGRNGRFIFIVDDSERKFLERALLEAAEREQRRIGQELHDHLCQHLLGAAFSAKALAGDLDRAGAPQSADLHDLARLINDAVAQVRDISRGLHPVERDEAGLMSALQELAARVSHTVPCDFVCEHPVLLDDPVQSLNAYRIAQEAAANALHTTGAGRITITLAAIPAGAVLTICDDGVTEGELTAHPDGIAAKTLTYRARAMRGEIRLAHAPGQGTRITCTFPRIP